MDLGKWWEEATKPIGNGIQNIGESIGEGWNQAGEKLNEAARAVTGGATEETEKNEKQSAGVIDLGFITILTGPKPPPQLGGYHFADSAVANSREDAEHEQDSSGGHYKRVVQKRAAHIPRSHFGDGRSHNKPKTSHQV